MKIALCFSGCPRLIDECYPDIKKYFIDGNDVDVFAHLWWDNSYQGKKSCFHSEHIYPNKDIGKLFQNLYNPIETIIEKQYSFEKNDIYEEDDNIICKKGDTFLWDKINYFNWQSQYYSKMKSAEICYEYAYENDIHYDYVIQCRTDMICDPGRYIIRILDNLKKIKSENEIYIGSTMIEEEEEEKGKGVIQSNITSDWFYIGSIIDIFVFSKHLYELLQIYRKYKTFNDQDYIVQVCQYTHLNYVVINSGTSIICHKSMFNGNNNETLFIESNHYKNNFDFKKCEWIDSDNNNLPYCAKHIRFK